LHKLVLLAVFMQTANGIRPATAQRDGTHTRPTVPSWCGRAVCIYWDPGAVFSDTGM